MKTNAQGSLLPTVRAKWRRSILLLVSAATMLSAKAAPPTSKPERAEFFANDLTGQTHRASEAHAKATLWVFISHDCPLCNGYAPELNRLANTYAKRGLKLNLVYAENDLPHQELAEHAHAFGYAATVWSFFADPDLRLAKACGVTVTPEVALVSSEGALLYRGRIDNRALAPGRTREQTTSFDLRSAVDATLAGRTIPIARTPAVGCALNFP